MKKLKDQIQLEIVNPPLNPFGLTLNPTYTAFEKIKLLLFMTKNTIRQRINRLFW
jgi:hypothetical protein